MEGINSTAPTNPHDHSASERVWGGYEEGSRRKKIEYLASKRLDESRSSRELMGILKKSHVDGQLNKYPWLKMRRKEREERRIERGKKRYYRRRIRTGGGGGCVRIPSATSCHRAGMSHLKFSSCVYELSNRVRGQVIGIPMAKYTASGGGRWRIGWGGPPPWRRGGEI